MLALAAALIVPLVLGLRVRRARWCGLLLLALLAGLGRTLFIHPPVTASDLSFYNGSDKAQAVRVTGVVEAEPVYGDTYQRLRIGVHSLLLPGATTPTGTKGALLALAPRYPAYSLGERLSLVGRLTPPPSSPGFDYAGYLAHHGVYSYMLYPKVTSLGPAESSGIAGAVAWVRAKVRAALQSSLPEPQAALTVGVVTGDRTTIPPAVQDAFTLSGTQHILAISGQNMTLLIGFVYLLYAGNTRRRLPGWLLFSSLLMLAAYTLFTGATPSVVRAAVMSGVLLMSQTLGRRFDPISALAVSAVLMTLYDPNLLADAGFLLSFAAMLGLAQVSPYLLVPLAKLRLPRLVAIPLAASLGAQIAVTPLLLLLTGRFSPVSPLATLTTEFALLPLMIAGIATGLLGSIFAPLGAVVGLLAWPWATWMLASVQWWAALPAATVQLPPVAPVWIATYYVVAASVVWWAKEGRPRLGMPAYQLALAVVAVGLWSLMLSMATFH